jgi:hypothetical protein
MRSRTSSALTLADPESHAQRGTMARQRSRLHDASWHPSRRGQRSACLPPGGRGCWAPSGGLTPRERWHSAAAPWSVFSCRRQPLPCHGGLTRSGEGPQAMIESTRVHALHHSWKPEAPHSAPQFEPPRRNRRGHSRLVSSPRELWTPQRPEFLSGLVGGLAAGQQLRMRMRRDG